RSAYAIATRADAHRVVVILEESDREALIERSDGVPDVAPQCRAEHRRCPNVKQVARVKVRPVAREAPKLGECAVADLDLRLVAGTIRNRPEQSDLRVGEMVDDAVE